jgi:hypothetical protein
MGVAAAEEKGSPLLLSVPLKTSVDDDRLADRQNET